MHVLVHVCMWNAFSGSFRCFCVQTHSVHLESSKVGFQLLLRSRKEKWMIKTLSDILYYSAIPWAKGLLWSIPASLFKHAMYFPTPTTCSVLIAVTYLLHPAFPQLVDLREQRLPENEQVLSHLLPNFPHSTWSCSVCIQYEAGWRSTCTNCCACMRLHRRVMRLSILVRVCMCGSVLLTVACRYGSKGPTTGRRVWEKCPPKQLPQRSLSPLLSVLGPLCGSNKEI